MVNSVTGQATEAKSTGNLILDSLPAAEREELQLHLQLIDLKQSHVLYNARTLIEQVYLPTNAMFSWVALTENGDMIEAGIVGYEGLVGGPVIMRGGTSPYQIEVELPGQAYKLSTTNFIDLYKRSHTLQQILLRYIQTQMTQLAQSVACSRFHTVEERLCRWLVGASDRIKSNELLLTQEILAHMIGARRPAVNIVTGTLQNAGLIRANRGKITIVDRERLLESACECYHIVKAEMDNYANFLANPQQMFAS